MKESLIVVRGPIGVGKTSVAKGLQKVVPFASFIETDIIKHMVGPDGSSSWRRTIAHEAAGFIVGQLLAVPRTAIVEVHTKYPAEVDRYKGLAAQMSTPLVNVLLTAPLEVCRVRTVGRDIPTISYRPDYSLVDGYYCNVDPQRGDWVYDTTAATTPEIVADIAGRLESF